MSTNRKPGGDQRDQEHQKDRDRSSDYAERSISHETFEVSNTRPAPGNPHRESDPNEERDK